MKIFNQKHWPVIVIIDNIDYVTGMGLETAHVSHRVNTSHGGALRVALTEAAE